MAIEETFLSAEGPNIHATMRRIQKSLGVESSRGMVDDLSDVRSGEIYFAFYIQTIDRWKIASILQGFADTDKLWSGHPYRFTVVVDVPAIVYEQKITGNKFGRKSLIHAFGEQIGWTTSQWWNIETPMSKWNINFLISFVKNY